MIVYFLGTIISVFLAHVAVKSKDRTKLKRNFELLSAMPLTLIAALRYGVGADYFGTYVRYFNLTLNGIRNITTDNFEIGFEILTKIIINFTNYYQWLFIICAIIFSFFIFKTIY